MGDNGVTGGNLGDFESEGDLENSRRGALAVQDMMHVIREACDILREAGRPDLATVLERLL